MKNLHWLTCEEFNNLITNKLYLENWLVYDMDAEDRAKMVSYTDKFKYLKQQSEKQDINARSAEIISWLDTMNIMYYVLDYVTPEILSELQILQEMEIPFTHKRADYVLVYRKKNTDSGIQFSKIERSL